MQVVRHFDDLTAALPSVVTIGAFDGVHVGHRHLIGQAVAQARAQDLRAVVVSFDPIPRMVLSKRRVRQLTTGEQKSALIEDLDADVLVLLRFDTALMAMSADQFVIQLVTRLGMQHLWVGEDFALGANRAGDVTFLRKAATRLHFGLHVALAQMDMAQVVSSSRIRAALVRGQASEAERLLGRSLLWHIDVGVGAQELLRDDDDSAAWQVDGEAAPLFFPMSDD